VDQHALRIACPRLHIFGQAGRVHGVPFGGQHLHAKGPRQAGQLAADTPVADDAQRRAAQQARDERVALARPLPRTLEGYEARQVVGEGQHHPQGILGHGHRVNAAGGGQDHVALLKQRVAQQTVDAGGRHLHPAQAGSHLPIRQHVSPGQQHVHLLPHIRGDFRHRLGRVVDHFQAGGNLAQPLNELLVNAQRHQDGHLVFHAGWFSLLYV